MKKLHSYDSIYDSQKMFRLILTAMSNPTKVVNIKKYSEKLYGEAPELLAVAMTLIDNEVSFSTCGDESLADEIEVLTFGIKDEIENADFIFTGDKNLEGAIELAKCGTLFDPHRSATLVVKIDGLKNRTLRLRGPGIMDAADIGTSDIVEKALQVRDRQFYEYPQGIDFIFVSGEGELFSVPRLIKGEVL